MNPIRYLPESRRRNLLVVIGVQNGTVDQLLLDTIARILCNVVRENMPSEMYGKV